MEDRFDKQLQALESALPLQDALSSINLSTLSYHQYNYHLNISAHKELLTVLKQTHSKKPVHSKLFDKFTNEGSKMCNSILCHGKDIMEDLSQLGNNSSNKIILHSHPTSQAFVLTAYLNHLHPVKPVLVSSKSQMHKHWLDSIVPAAEVDKKLAFDQIVGKEQIKIYFWNKELNLTKEQQHLIIIDVFDMPPTDYQPYLLKFLQEINLMGKKCVIYCSTVQEAELMEILGCEENNWEFSELSSTAPFECFQGNVEEELEKFLMEESVHPVKQDILIFHQPTQTFLRKLSQMFKRSKLASNISFITKPSQPLPPPHISTIYVAPNVSTLLSWKYPLNKIFYIFDYGEDQTFYYDYKYLSYVQRHHHATVSELAKRMGIVSGVKMGKYCYEHEVEGEDEHFLENGKGIDLGTYCLRMILFGFGKKLYWDNKNIKACVKALEEAGIIKKEGQEYVIVKKDILKCLKTGINPLNCLNILQNKEKPKLSLLLAMASSILMNPFSLRQKTKETSTDRPAGIWRQSGYLHSCIDAVVRSRIIQRRINQNKVSKRLTSRFSRASESESPFGLLFEIVHGTRMTFDEMKTEDLVREELINESVLLEICEKYEQIIEILEIEEIDFTNFEEINDVIYELLNNRDRGAGVFSGSRRIGYLIKGQPTGIFPNKSSLISLLNQRPPFIFINRLLRTKQNKLQILMCNHLSQLQFMELFSELPTSKQSSYGETQLEFHGISSAMFSSLWRAQSHEISTFEQKFECFVEPNEQVAMITIHCNKDNSGVVKNQFDQVLTKIKKKMINEKKIVPYFGNTSATLGVGGTVEQLIKNKYIGSCILTNLCPSVTEEDLFDLFDEFFTLKSIKLNPPDEKSKHYSSATIQFLSQKDYFRFYEYYHECMYLDRLMKVIPIETKPKSNVLGAEMYIEMIWLAWKSLKKAMVQYQTEGQAQKGYQALTAGQLDGRKVSVVQNGSKLFLEEIKGVTDEKTIEKSLNGVGGRIKHIQIERTPLKQPSSMEDQLNTEIRKVFGEAEVEWEIRHVEKQKNGVRKCEVVFKQINRLNEMMNNLNQKLGIMGVGRVHLQAWYTHPVNVPFNAMSLYDELTHNVLKKLKKNHQVKLVHLIYNGVQYIIAKSPIKSEIDLFKDKMQQELSGYKIDLSGLEQNILLSEVGIQNLMDLQEKYLCRLVPDFNKKELFVQTSEANLKKIKEEIKAKVQDKFFYRIPLNQKAFKYLKQKPQTYTQMQKQYHLSHLQLEEVGRNLILEGNAHHIQNAFNYLMHLIQSIMVPSEEMLNADVCGICCEEPFRPYRLQQCGHKFCLQCVMDHINMTLGDISMFPVKCPQCLADMVVDDLNALLTKQTWEKLVSMSVNLFAGKNAETVTFCFTAGCKQINYIMGSYFKCDACQSSYCLECKQDYHPGLTCQQARENTNALFEKYMKENNIRKCPNKACNMPIYRVDGCYRVTCTRCGKSMCFKCEPDKMIAYDNYNDCYRHLSEVHGSYW